MLPHVLGATGLRTRSQDTGVLADWLNQELRLSNPEVNPDLILRDAYSKHPLDRSAFIEALLKDPVFTTILGDHSIDELVAQFESRLPATTIPIVLQGDRSHYTVSGRSAVIHAFLNTPFRFCRFVGNSGILVPLALRTIRSGTQLNSLRPRGP